MKMTKRKRYKHVYYWWIDSTRTTITANGARAFALVVRGSLFMFYSSYEQTKRRRIAGRERKGGIDEIGDATEWC